ncbi:hypothetical protein [Nonomuraea africana]|uniref:Secreted protein n=1 Tax=Nonomuraea africana TaxID=46171 RepID=A0ABR9KQD0_9ACTN|nr:hypothetical protein [Nonomuraea africana]MBE1563803.1 hypothetical protein [Nonomuraea africana]
MKRIIKAAVAVAVCGLAAAVAVPAQADNSIRVNGHGVVESLSVTGQTAGFRSLPPFTGRASVATSTIDREALATGAAPAATGVLLNGQEAATVSRVHDSSGPYDEVDRLIDKALNISPKDLYEAALDKARQDVHGAATAEDEPFIDSILRSLGDTTSSETGMAPAREGLTSQSDTAGGAVENDARVAPRMGAPELAPLIREAMPSQAAPIADSLPGVVSAATLDEIAPLVDAATDVVDNNTHRSVNSVGETQGAVAESIAQTNDLAAQH